jgi:cytochrome c-type protein NapC
MGMPRSSVIVLLLVGIFVFAIFTYDYTMKATSTEEFCISCHEMASGPFVLLQDTTHFRNESGVRPTCSDCHVPKEGWPKIWRKIQSSREYWSALTGKIDTPEKYLAHVRVMKNREIARMQANDSKECRNCHDVAAMDLDQQSRMAKLSHSSMQSGKITCIDCHKGIAHDTLVSAHEGGE